MKEIAKLDSFKDVSENLDRVTGFLDKMTFLHRRIRNIEKLIERLQEDVNKRNVKIYVDGKEMMPGDDTIYHPTNKRKKRK